MPTRPNSVSVRLRSYVPFLVVEMFRRKTKREGKLVACFPSKKWFGVNASSSRELAGVIGLKFKTCSAKQSVVPNTSFVTCLLPSIA